MKMFRYGEYLTNLKTILDPMTCINFNNGVESKKLRDIYALCKYKDQQVI